MYRRILESSVAASLADTPVVLVGGARQTGKTTLVQRLAQSTHSAQYVTLDDIVPLSAARSDAVGFLAGFSGPVIIDDVQHAPELFSAIKQSVDRDRTPGRFLLTASANAPVLPRLSDSLAGRMEIHVLWPLAQAELLGTSATFVDDLFRDRLPRQTSSPVDRAALANMLAAGGYP